MTQFWIGYAAGIATYFGSGFGIGVFIVFTNQARFFSAGWQWRKMLDVIGIATLLGPAALFF